MVCHLCHWTWASSRQGMCTRRSVIHSVFSLETNIVVYTCARIMLDTEVFQDEQDKIKVSALIKFCQITTQTIIRSQLWLLLQRGLYSLWTIVMVAWTQNSGEAAPEEGMLTRISQGCMEKKTIPRVEKSLGKGPVAGEAKSSTYMRRREGENEAVIWGWRGSWGRIRQVMERSLLNPKSNNGIHQHVSSAALQAGKLGETQLCTIRELSWCPLHKMTS